MDSELKTLLVALVVLAVTALVLVPLAGRLGEGASAMAVRDSHLEPVLNLANTNTVAAVAPSGRRDRVRPQTAESFTGVVSRIVFAGATNLLSDAQADVNLREILCDGLSKTPADVLAALRFVETLSVERAHSVALALAHPQAYDPTNRTLRVAVAQGLTRGEYGQIRDKELRRQVLTDIATSMRLDLRPVVAYDDAGVTNEVCIVFRDAAGNVLSFPWPDRDAMSRPLLRIRKAPMRADPSLFASLTGAIERVVLREARFPVAGLGLEEQMALKLCDGRRKTADDVREAADAARLLLARSGLLLAQVSPAGPDPYDAMSRTFAFRVELPRLRQLTCEVVDGAGRRYRTDGVAKCLDLLCRDGLFDYHVIRSVLRFLDGPPEPCRP